MGYRIDDSGYACVECGKRVWSREEAEDCQADHAAEARPYATALDARVSRLRTALRLAAQRCYRARAAALSVYAREECGGALRQNGTPENPQAWRPVDQRAYDWAECWNGWRLRLERQLGRAITRRNDAWNRMALDR